MQNILRVKHAHSECVTLCCVSIRFGDVWNCDMTERGEAAHWIRHLPSNRHSTLDVTAVRDVCLSCIILYFSIKCSSCILTKVNKIKTNKHALKVSPQWLGR